MFNRIFIFHLINYNFITCSCSCALFTLHYAPFSIIQSHRVENYARVPECVRKSWKLLISCGLKVSNALNFLKMVKMKFVYRQTSHPHRQRFRLQKVIKTLESLAILIRMTRSIKDLKVLLFTRIDLGLYMFKKINAT